MPLAVKFDEYGGVDVLRIVEVDLPTPGPGQVLVRVKAAGINPVESGIRSGALAAVYPATFPSGQGTDLAGIVESLGAGVTEFAVGDDVLGFTGNRASHAEFVLAEAANLTIRPDTVSWEAAGGLFIAGAAAYAAVRAVSVSQGDTVVVAGAAGGVGSIAVQLARNAGAKVVGLASQSHHEWLTEHGVVPVSYGDGVADRIRAATGNVDAFIDAFGADYVDLALAIGVASGRINTLVNFAAVGKHGVKAQGNNDAASAEVLAELAGLIDKGLLDVPIAGAFPLTSVHEAYQLLEQRRTRGKIVLLP